MSAQITLLTSHKGIDLHAATAVRVMQRHLGGGDALVALRRCEMHTFWEGADAPDVAALLAIGRYFNPNKHHFGHFRLADGGDPWFARGALAGADLDASWPGVPVASSLSATDDDLHESLLGGAVADDLVAVDVASFALGEPGPLLSGVLWRLVLRPEGRAPRRLADRLAVSRAGDQGLLVNPHLHGWLTAVRTAAAVGGNHE